MMFIIQESNAYNHGPLLFLLQDDIPKPQVNS